MENENNYLDHAHPHGVEDLPPNPHRIWVCDECDHIFADDEIRIDLARGKWAHECKCHPKRKGQRCESHLEPFIPELPSQEEVTRKEERELIGLWLNANLRDHFALHSGMWKLRRGKSPENESLNSDQKHNEIMNLKIDADKQEAAIHEAIAYHLKPGDIALSAYKRGHRDARHAAAELASQNKGG